MHIQIGYFLYVVLFYSVSADDEFDGTIEAHLSCPPMDNFVLQGFGSKSPFFGDALSTLCASRGEGVCSDDGTESHFFESPDGGLTLEAGCPADNQIIKSIRFHILDAHVIAAGLDCCTLREPSSGPAVSAEPEYPSLARCPEGTAMQKIALSDAGDTVTTKVAVGCVMLPDDKIEGFAAPKPLSF